MNVKTKRLITLLFFFILAVGFTTAGIADDSQPYEPEVYPGSLLPGTERPADYNLNPWAGVERYFLGLLPAEEEGEEEGFVIEPRIIGGFTVNPENLYPWAGSYQFSGEHYCGATLIDPEWAVTSAHCLVDANGVPWVPNPVNDRLVLGEYNLETVSGNEQVIPIVEFHIHPLFELTKFKYDIALMKLQTPATSNAYVQPIDLIPSDGYYNISAKIVGWGSLDYPPTIWPDELQHATVKVLPNSGCSYYGVAFDPSSMLCGGVVTGGIDACKGDSGGGMFVNIGGTPYLIGVTSWGNKCAVSGFPGVYARVATTSTWINGVRDPILNGSVEITSDQDIVAISRPHILNEIMAYNGSNGGSLTSFLPMLFNGKWNYTSTFTVQNTTGSTASFDLVFKDGDNGVISCEISGESLPGHGVRTYDVASLGSCDGGGTLVGDWFGGATIESNQPLAVVAKPDIEGYDAVTYSAFSGGAATAYLPMLFRGKWGYQAAFYVQNLDSTQPADVKIDFYDSDGVFTCTFDDLDTILPAATRGYWMAGITGCTGGTGFPSSGWAGSAVIMTEGAGSANIVAIGRPHLGTEVAAYNGFTSGGTENYLPMLFRLKWGYDSAFYIQNIASEPVPAADITITFYDVDGTETCRYVDPTPLPQNATRGYWTPSLNCNDGRNFPDTGGWAGSAKIETNVDVIAVGRPHLSDGQVVVYNAFTGGSGSAYLPFNFRQWYGNETALYIQNLGGEDANTIIRFYDEEDGLYCEMTQVVAPGSSGAIWLAGISDLDCPPVP